MAKDGMTTMGQVRAQNSAKGKTLGVLIVVAIFELFVVSFTAAHNIPLMWDNTHPSFRWVATATGIAGEVFAIVTLILTFFLAGHQRQWALAGHVVMLAILLFNSALNWAGFANPAILKNIFMEMYLSILMPLILMGTIAIFSIALSHNDPGVKIRNANNKIQDLQLGMELLALETLAANIEGALDSPEDLEAIRRAGRAVVSKAMQNMIGRGDWGGEPSRPMLPAPRPMNEVEPVRRQEPPETRIPPPSMPPRGGQNGGQNKFRPVFMGGNPSRPGVEMRVGGTVPVAPHENGNGNGGGKPPLPSTEHFK